MGSCGFCSIFAGCHAKLRHSLPLGLRSFSEILVLCGTDWGLWDDDMPISICTFYTSSNGSYTVHTLPPVFVGAMPSSEPLCIICWLVPGLVQNVFIVRRGKKLQETPCLMEEPMVSCRFPSPTRIGIPMVYLWYAYGMPMVCLWYAYGMPMVYLWYTYGIPMVYL